MTQEISPCPIWFFYNLPMARGWESKSVEAQQAEAFEGNRPSRAKMTVQQAALQRQIDGLLLSRQRVRQQLAAARDARLRHMLESGLDDLDRGLRDPQSD